jgi:opacity protein-like surface antigen
MRTDKVVLLASFVTLLWFPARANAQKLEVAGGYAHVTGDLGLDGYNLAAGLWLSRRLSASFDYDSVYDTSKIGVFELTHAGEISVKSHLQNFLVGPRIYFPGALKTKRLKYGRRLTPFAEVALGGTHLNTTVRQLAVGEQSASDNAFSWMLGGGADYVIDPHWAARIKIDLLRTHIADTGQSRLRIGLGIAYTFGSR